MGYYPKTVPNKGLYTQKRTLHPKYIYSGEFFLGKFFPEYFFPDLNPKYIVDIANLNTAPNFVIYDCLFNNLIREALLSWRATGRQQSDVDETD